MSEAGESVTALISMDLAQENPAITRLRWALRGKHPPGAPILVLMSTGGFESSLYDFVERWKLEDVAHMLNVPPTMIEQAASSLALAMEVERAQRRFFENSTTSLDPESRRKVVFSCRKPGDVSFVAIDEVCDIGGLMIEELADLGTIAKLVSQEPREHRRPPWLAPDRARDSRFRERPGKRGKR